jgi:hypothetical protein
MKLNAQLFWVNDSVTLNTNFDPANKKYKLTVCNVSEKAAAKLNEDFGIKVKNNPEKPEYGLHFNAKSLYAWEFKDDAGNAVAADAIGNGTKAEIDVTGSYAHKFEKQHGKGPVVNSRGGVVIKELVARDAPSSDSGESL